MNPWAFVILIEKIKPKSEFNIKRLFKNAQPEPDSWNDLSFAIYWADFVRRSSLRRAKAERVGFPSGKFPNENFLRACPRGVRLSSAVWRTQTHTALRASNLLSTLFYLNYFR